ncbi:hypothetical protein AC578_10843 [Pseudocercospora eumusae]|uniref:Uncharacterized protein n=1 Tax=Pseudocercospora eumusae TaxID=321146 RepID=A0A139H8W7_9PEZI|nr:hypothetical protein AC578_10843 [Pseudocercospora eumusae]
MPPSNGAFNAEVLAELDKIKQPTGAGEILTLRSWELYEARSRFRWHVRPSCCESYCTTGFLHHTAPLFPAAKPSDVYIQPDTGHGMNLHYNPTGAYKVIVDWMERNI